MTDTNSDTQHHIIARVRSRGSHALSETAVERAKHAYAILNSSLGRWHLAKTGDTIPVPKLSAKEQAPIVRLVDAILEAKDADPGADTSGLEWEIDGLVYDLYGLTAGERLAVYEGVAELVGNRKAKAGGALTATRDDSPRGAYDDAVARNIVARGQSIYDEKIRHKVEETERGKFVVIDVFSGDYEMDDRHADASRRLVARHAGAITCTIRIGFRNTYKFGFRSRYRKP